MKTPILELNEFHYTDLFEPEKLLHLDQQFIDYLKDIEPLLVERLIDYRYNASDISATKTSEFLIELGAYVGRFIARLFKIEQEVEILQTRLLSHDPIFIFKDYYIKKLARRRVNKDEIITDFTLLDAWLLETLGEYTDFELAVAQLGTSYLNNPEEHTNQIEQLTQWCIHILRDHDIKPEVSQWVSLKQPQRIDYDRLVRLKSVGNDDRQESDCDHIRERDGFSLTDERMTSREVMREIDYCVYCHDKEGDFCSKGFPVKKAEPELGLKQNSLDEYMTGCPLEERISEMHVLKKAGKSISALAMIMLDNPMCPITGHRICNDCMKACIYQKQDPVDIPQVETSVLTDVLKLPWGVEIYDLLTRWNPLRSDQWVIKPYNGKKVLVMGMGPAGLTLAHHLLLEGCAVVGVDGLKIEPLPESYINEPIYSYDAIKEDLDSRIMSGFGGVAEYGITVRWDKNFLKLIYITLMRRKQFQVFGGVRFGGTLTVEDAWSLGFDHLAVAVGAGLPRALPIKGSMAPGMRQANDFLMALQLTGAAKSSSLASLQLRLPAVVIGGGLTGVDAATEAQAYYIKQVEKTLLRYEKLSEVFGEARVREHFDTLSLDVLEEFVVHGREVVNERQLAATENRAPNFNPLIRKWGGVTIVYRRTIQDSPAYKRNHEELNKALEEGIYYVECLDPYEALLDKNGHVSQLACHVRVKNDEGQWEVSEDARLLSAKSILVATGAKPNVAYEFEHYGTFHREGMEYKAYDDVSGDFKIIHPDAHCKTKSFGPFTSYDKHDRRVSFLGDTHPVFHGSVVKAIASAKRIYPKIMNVLDKQAPIKKNDDCFLEGVRLAFDSTITKLVRHTPSVIEIQIHSPMATRNFKPGHFYRLQNFETDVQEIEGTKLQTEALAVSGSVVDKEKGLISLMILEQGASSRLVATFTVGDKVSLMGPTGVRTKIPKDKETIMLVGGRLGAASILSLGPALRASGNKVLFFAGFDSSDEVFCQRRLEEAADIIVWVTKVGKPVKTNREQDASYVGNLFEVMRAYGAGDLDAPIPLQTLDRVLVIGANNLVKGMQDARHSTLKTFFSKEPRFIGSVYGSMQCMLKGVCAQCLQWQIDPKTGQRTKAVYACSWHDQPMEMIDVDNVDERLVQNRTQEILSGLWLDYLFAHYNISRI